MKSDGKEHGPALVFGAWRISEHADLSGMGGEYRDGRWHNARPETPIVYLSETTAAAILEVLVHLDGRLDEFPRTYQLLRISSSQRIAIKTLDREEHSYDRYRRVPKLQRLAIAGWPPVSRHLHVFRRSSRRTPGIICSIQNIPTPLT